MKCLTINWLRPAKRSASVSLPSGPSKTYSLSILTQGKARRSAFNRSRIRVNSFSFARSSLRATSHSSRVTTGCCIACLLLSEGRQIFGQPLQTAGPAAAMGIARRHRLENGLAQGQLGPAAVLDKAHADQGLVAG